jgi:nitronate monooxygenase
MLRRRSLLITKSSGSSGGRAPFSSEIADVLDEFKPPVVSFHFGLPPAELLARVRSWGSKVLSSAATVDEARWLETRGIDAIIAQGLEAGGHRGMFLSEDLVSQVGTLALVPQIVVSHREVGHFFFGIAIRRPVARRSSR